MKKEAHHLKKNSQKPKEKYRENLYWSNTYGFLASNLEVFRWTRLYFWKKSYLLFLLVTPLYQLSYFVWFCLEDSKSAVCEAIFNIIFNITKIASEEQMSNWEVNSALSILSWEELKVTRLLII